MGSESWRTVPLAPSVQGRQAPEGNRLQDARKEDPENWDPGLPGAPQPLSYTQLPAQAGKPSSPHKRENGATKNDRTQ